MKVIFFFLSILFLTSCLNDEDAFSTTCNINNPLENLVFLKEARETIDRIDCGVNKSSITQYTYKSKTVFEVNICANILDGQTLVYNCNGEVICRFGGIAGENTCPDFYDTVTNKIVLYEN
jgi:hypothetical protein